MNADVTTRVEATEILRGLISAVRPTADESGGVTIELVGEQAAILALGDKRHGPDHEDRGRSATMVAGPAISEKVPTLSNLAVDRITPVVSNATESRPGLVH